MKCKVIFFLYDLRRDEMGYRYWFVNVAEITQRLKKPAEIEDVCISEIFDNISPVAFEVDY